MSWTLAAVGEEVAYRGYLQTRIRELLPDGRSGLVMAVALSSALFGLAHTEQGLVGILLATSDAIFFSVLRYRYRTLWASVLAHGFLNSIGHRGLLRRRALLWTLVSLAQVSGRCGSGPASTRSPGRR